VHGNCFIIPGKVVKPIYKQQAEESRPNHGLVTEVEVDKFLAGCIGVQMQMYP
jgi:hypothetical protein